MTARIDFSSPDIAELKKKFMVVDPHVHSRYSYDSGTQISTILERAKELGIRVAITDHNRIGGAIEAHESALGRRLVVPGIEVTTREKKDLLVYFYKIKHLQQFYDDEIQRRIKKKNSLRLNTTSYKMAELLAQLQQEECVTVLPHPVCTQIKSTYSFFTRKHRSHLLNYIDAIEVINETMKHKSNLTALGWAVSMGKPFTAGSDGHRIDRVGEAVTAARAKTIKQYLDAVKAGETHVAGKELRMSERLNGAWHLIAEKAKIRSNRRIDRDTRNT